MNTFVVVISSILVLITSLILGFRALNSFIPPPVAYDNWWGHGDGPAEFPNISSIAIQDMPAIHFNDETLADLQQRLANARYFRPMKGTNWEYGSDIEDMKAFTRYWLKEFNWRKQEKVLNGFKHFIATVDGIKLHYVHAKPEIGTNKVIPILLLHGWPGSFYEFYKVIPLLTNMPSSEYDFAFEVVCPSLPGYIFSEGPHRPGQDPLQIANLFRKLMARLGFNHYYIQGGDWGSVIGRVMALIDASHVKGIHVNMYVTGPPYGPFSFLSAYLFPSWSLGSEAEQRKVLPLWGFLVKLLWESGYFHLQATKPDSIGVAMNDSPVGLAAYILEKFFTWSGCKSNDTMQCLQSKFTKDELLTNIMLYWLTASMPTAMRLCKENRFDRSYASPIAVPTAIASFPNEPFQVPFAWLHVAFPNIVQITEMPRGGHFPALEEPRLFVDDIWKFVNKVEKRVTANAN